MFFGAAVTFPSDVLNSAIMEAVRTPMEFQGLNAALCEIEFAENAAVPSMAITYF